MTSSKYTIEEHVDDNTYQRIVMSINSRTKDSVYKATKIAMEGNVWFRLTMYIKDQLREEVT